MTLFSFENLYQQYLACRRGKRNTANALRFEARQELELLALRDELSSRSYQPGRSVCFFVNRPKLREVFAADFRDRVVHHILVSHLNKTWERTFIHDSYACRKGRGVHAGVARLQTFMRQATANGTRQAWALHLDIRNYFMSIDKARLFAMVAARLDVQKPQDAEALWLAETLIFHDCTVQPHIKGNPALLAQLPPHKTLFGAAPGVGLPIGNLNSQFFANVYLYALDQFAKHTLKCRWYLRYCDDFVLLAHSAEELLAWRERIAEFLADELALQLNPQRQRLCPVADGVDFLGYIVRPTHLLVRRRVVGHLRDTLRVAQRRLVQQMGVGGGMGGVEVARFDVPVLDALQASLASYLGHVRKAAHGRLVQAMWHAHPWLANFFRLESITGALHRRDKPPATQGNLLHQYAHWQREFAGDEVWLQVGAFIERFRWPPRHWARPQTAPHCRLQRMRANRRGAEFGFPLEQLARRVAAACAAGRSVTLVAQVTAVSVGATARRPGCRWCRPDRAASLPSTATRADRAVRHPAQSGRPAP